MKPGIIGNEEKGANIEPNHVGLMKNAIEEIERLRRHNHVMAGKLAMFDKCMKLIEARIDNDHEMTRDSGRDLVHQMRSEVNSISKV